MAVVTPLNNFMGPEGDTVTADNHYSILNTQKPLHTALHAQTSYHHGVNG